ncbi:MAG: phosphodiesterase [Deltaproteobacteria bacterium]|nr:MAG: phosphodiesterase [Deltaproteobacteria bacterium]
MKLGIISDTHGGLMGWEKAFEGPLSQVNLILHAGDLLYHGPRNALPDGYDPSSLALSLSQSPISLLIAQGNCDAEVDQLLLDYSIQSPYVYSFIDGLALLMLHGHELGMDALLELGERYRINLLITGHTHIYQLLQKGSLTLINPGSPLIPKGEEIPTAALVDTERSAAAIWTLDTNEVVREIPIFR